MQRFVPIVHAVAAVFAIIELGLTAYSEFSPLSTIPTTHPVLTLV